MPTPFRFAVQSFSADSAGARAGSREPIAEGMAQRFGFGVDEMRAHPHALFGTVDEVVDELVRRRETYGISYVTVGDDAMDAFAPVVAKLRGC